MPKQNKLIISECACNTYAHVVSSVGVRFDTLHALSVCFDSVARSHWKQWVPQRYRCTENHQSLKTNISAEKFPNGPKFFLQVLVMVTNKKDHVRWKLRSIFDMLHLREVRIMPKITVFLSKSWEWLEKSPKMYWEKIFWKSPNTSTACICMPWVV